MTSAWFWSGTRTTYRFIGKENLLRDLGFEIIVCNVQDVVIMVSCNWRCVINSDDITNENYYVGRMNSVWEDTSAEIADVQWHENLKRPMIVASKSRRLRDYLKQTNRQTDKHLENLVFVISALYTFINLVPFFTNIHINVIYLFSYIYVSIRLN